MKTLLCGCLKFYKKVISPYMKLQCKFYPTCSDYSSIAIKEYGVLIGCFKTMLRLFRCNPFSKGGIDFP